MIINFQFKDVTFFDEDKAYYEKRIQDLEKIFGWEKGDEDSIEVSVHLEKTKEHSGNRFIASAHIVAPHHGKFHAEVSADNIKKGADLLKDKLKAQIQKFHDAKK